VAFPLHGHAERIANEDLSDLEVRVGFALTRATAAMPIVIMHLLEKNESRFGKMPL
jgi:hypothetical protein